MHCGREGSLLCAQCVRESTTVSKDVCRECAEQLSKPGTCTRCVIENSQLDRLYGSFLYESPVGTAVRAFKFEDVRALAAVLGGMFDVESLKRADADLIVPIPMHKSRMRSRGFNQSELLARKLADRLNAEIRSDVLVRSRNTVPQSEMRSAAERKTAIQGAFSIRPDAESSVSDSRVLLVDDVFTTGRTIQSAARALKSAGASWVGAAALTVQPVGALK